MDTATVESPNTTPQIARPVGRPGAPRKLRLKTLNQLDGRTYASRRARQVMAAIETDLGGSDALTEAVHQLAQRAAVLGALIESNETTWLAGDAIDMQSYFIAVNAQRRILTTLGLERRSRNVTPDALRYAREVTVDHEPDIDRDDAP